MLWLGTTLLPGHVTQMWEIIGKYAVGYFAGVAITFAYAQSTTPNARSIGDGLVPIFNFAMAAAWPALLAGSVAAASTTLVGDLVFGRRE